jgi:uncharacterized protein (TIGR02996 family)
MMDVRSWDDPRLSTQILKLLRTMPFSGRRTRYVWGHIFQVARTQRDYRFVVFADKLMDGWNVGDDLKRYLSTRLLHAIEGLAEPVLADAGAIRALVDELCVPGQRVATEEDLLAAIYEHPDDDGPRLVYADWLQERDDPRGEFITLQLAGDAKRAKPLGNKHKKALLGPLAPIVAADVEFRRGFVAKCTAKFRNQRDAEHYGNLPAWRTVEELEFGSGATIRNDQRDWARYVGPTMTNVRRVRDPAVRFLLAGGPWRIEFVELNKYSCDAEAFRALLASDRLPHLVEILLSGGAPASYLDGVTRCPRRLGFWTSLDYELDQRLGLAKATSAEVIAIHSGGIQYDFTRDDAGAFTRVEVVLRAPAMTETNRIVKARDLVEQTRAQLKRFVTHASGVVEIDGELVAV